MTAGSTVPGTDGEFTGYMGTGDLASFFCATTYPATIFAPGTVPEPGSILLMGLGVLGLLAARRKTAA